MTKFLNKIKEILTPNNEVKVQEPTVKKENIEKKVSTPEVENTWYTGIPAPNIPTYDPWFGPVVLSEKAIVNMMQEVKEKQEERENNFSVEPDNIHQVMYDVATKNNNTTLDLNPLSPGGSENFHEGPGSWSSGTGQNQFR